MGGLAEPHVGEAAFDGSVGVGEGDVGGLRLVAEVTPVVHPGDERPPLGRELLDGRRRHRVALALDGDDEDGVVEVVLADGLTNASLALARFQVEVNEDELAGIGDGPARHRDGHGVVVVERYDVVAALGAFLGARPLR